MRLLGEDKDKIDDYEDLYFSWGERDLTVPTVVFAVGITLVVATLATMLVMLVM